MKKFIIYPDEHYAPLGGGSWFWWIPGSGRKNDQYVQRTMYQSKEKTYFSPYPRHDWNSGEII